MSWCGIKSVSAKTFFFIYLFIYLFLEITCIWAEKTFKFRIMAEKSVSISAKTLFFLEITRFWAKKTFEFRIMVEKSVSISAKTFFFFFFFLEITCFWAEKTFEFPNFPRNSVSIFGQTVWYWFKTNENSVQGRLHFSHSFKKAPPPPFPNPGYAPDRALVDAVLFAAVASPDKSQERFCFTETFYLLFLFWIKSYPNSNPCSKTNPKKVFGNPESVFSARTSREKETK